MTQPTPGMREAMANAEAVARNFGLMGFRDTGVFQNWGYHFGVPVIRTTVIVWGLYWGSISLGNHHNTWRLSGLNKCACSLWLLLVVVDNSR